MKHVALCFLLLITLTLSATRLAVAQEKTDDGIDDEKAIKVFAYLVDGETAARSHLTDLRRIAAATPYQPLVIAGISRQLLVWGWKADEAKQIISASANAGAGVGGDNDRFTRIALAVGRLTDSEESTYAALSALEDEGIPSWQI